MPSSEFFFNIRLEGETEFTSAAGGAVAEIKVRTRVVIEAGLTDWKDEPYRANVITKFLGGGDTDDTHDERRFATDEELCSWLESYIADLTKRGFETVRYKANGLPIDWLNRIGLPVSE
jgi:hypothetical protein